MADPLNGPKAEFSLLQLLPNMLTIAAICAGLSAIRFGVQGNYMLAVQLIILAGILDGLDGRIARLLDCCSRLGAELDSLADFMNFGAAPALILYFWAFQDNRGAAWIAVLVFAICCGIRLARFNVGSKSDSDNHDNAYFEGIPSPAGAMLVMMPMYLSFAFSDFPRLPDVIICIYMIVIGLLLVSRIPTWSFKTTRIPREKVKFFLIGVAAVGTALVTFPWAMLIVLCVGYVGMVIWACIDRKRPAG
ncbi:CDP-diacylglycerol--serine O-phosphatidyltransferase [Paracoccus onubensis]|uniref:CDP-diacylglycerol--serine O-phosphatidyltransferase n=1 Tax=Paracoccus onubensis TaxID=1675788 RepID=UPI0027315091|nr:CDP-diacylglycerol--serine O-phosphatidyltransferase [Paracoccus onubensis]MDP0929725.1 CDP-diacylglycerol--serine O-phosphatidyltransferase [Paracoccus onubensis]